jgi:hypothetical protein
MTGITASAELSLWYLPASAAVVLLLAFQGLARRAEAQSVISRAVLSGTIRHPMETLLARFDDAS